MAEDKKLSALFAANPGTAKANNLVYLVDPDEADDDDKSKALPVSDVGISLLASATVDLQNGDSKTTAYTVTAAKSAIVTHVIIRNPTASLAGGTDFDIGDGASADTWKTTIDLSSLTATTDCIIIVPPTAKFTVFDAADEFGILPVTGATADAQATMDVFGYEF